MDIKNKIELGHTGILVSPVGFGVHPLGPSRKNLSVEEGAKLMRYAYEQGICFFDTAQFYRTYHYLRAALEQIRRSPLFYGEPVISSKSLEEDYEGMMAAIDEALEETGRECIDIFLMHQVTPGYRKERAGARAALIEARRQGKVKAIGIPPTIRTWCWMPPMTRNMIWSLHFITMQGWESETGQRQEVQKEC